MLRNEELNKREYTLKMMRRATDLPSPPVGPLEAKAPGPFRTIRGNGGGRGAGGATLSVTKTRDWPRSKAVAKKNDGELSRGTLSYMRVSANPIHSNPSHTMRWGVHYLVAESGLARDFWGYFIEVGGNTGQMQQEMAKVRELKESRKHSSNTTSPPPLIP